MKKLSKLTNFIEKMLGKRPQRTISQPTLIINIHIEILHMYEKFLF